MYSDLLLLTEQVLALNTKIPINILVTKKADRWTRFLEFNIL